MDKRSKGRARCIWAIVALSWILAASAATAGDLILEGDFETGSFGAGWTHGAGTIGGGLNPSRADHTVVLDNPASGMYSALLGFKYTAQKKDRYGFMSYDITVPSNISGAVLYFKYRQQGYDGMDYDPFIAEVRDQSDNILETIVHYSFADRDGQYKDSGWINEEFDLSAYEGQAVRIYFRQENRLDNDYATWVFIDDVAAVFKKFVDLIVESSGEDVFGDLGTGDGGTALLSAEEGETVIYDLAVENESLGSDSYTITASSPPGWAVVVNYMGTDYALPWNTPELASGEVLQAEVRVTVPVGQAPGSYESILDVVSINSGNRFDSVTLGTDVVLASNQADLVIDGDGLGAIGPDGGGGSSVKTSPPDSILTYDIELHNSGAETDSFRIWFDGTAPLEAVLEEGPVAHTGQFVTGAIPSGGVLPLVLRVTVLSGTRGGEYETLIFAQSVIDTLQLDGVTAYTRVRAPGVDAIICGSGDDIVDASGSGLGGSGSVGGTRGSTVRFPVTIQNEGALVDSFLVEWDAPPGPWTAVISDGTNSYPLPWTTTAFAPKSEREYTLEVTIPQNAKLKAYNSILDITSLVDGTWSESVTASINVIEANEIDIVIDGYGYGLIGAEGSGLGGTSNVTAYAGDTLTFQIDVFNIAGEDLFDLQWTTPDGWQVSIGDSTSTMRGVTSGSYALRVIIPESAATGSTGIILDGMKSNKQYLVDSVTGMITIIAPNNMDVVIDGDGAGVIGAPGTGAGGLSLRDASEGLTAAYSVDIYNNDAAGSDYIVSWTTPPGWTAVFDGNTSPHATNVIPAGGMASYSFEVTVPLGTVPGGYDFILDFVSGTDPANVESVNARVRVNPPAGTDLVIEGDGALEYGPAGSGEGGTGLVFGDPGTVITASLELYNNGGSADSFSITWSDPAGWPAGSVQLSDGTGTYTSPFASPSIPAGGSAAYTLVINVPAGASLRNIMIIDGVSITGGYEDSALLEIGTGCVITGRVFEDSDHDGAPGAGESGLSGVQVTLTDPSGDITSVTDGAGVFSFEAAAGPSRDVVETTPSGMISLSPDTVGTGVTAAGDTVFVYFADIWTSYITPVREGTAPAGGIVDLAHRITAGTSGQATLNAYLPLGWTAEFYRDQNDDGVIDPGDTRLTAADLLLDPETPGSDVVPVIMRVFVPPLTTVGVTYPAQVVLQQEISGTTLTVQSSVTDNVLVLASASGNLDLVKAVDLPAARPGDVITYTITYSNPGAEPVSEIEIVDPVSPSVDLLADAFGAGQDIAWTTDSGTVYLTADPADPDEALYDSGSGTLRLVLSRQAPFILESGETGQITYQVRIR